MLSQLFHAHVDLHVKGLPAWMSKMNPDKMSVKDRSHVVRDSPPARLQKLPVLRRVTGQQHIPGPDTSGVGPLQISAPRVWLILAVHAVRIACGDPIQPIGAANIPSNSRA